MPVTKNQPGTPDCTMRFLEDWRDGPTQRRVAAIAVPMTLSNLSTPLVTFAGSIIAGHLAQTHSLGAVAIGSTLYMMPVWVLGFLRMSTSGLTAQAHGRGDAAGQFQVLQRALRLAALLGGLLLLAGLWLTPILIGWMHPGPGLAELARGFMRWRWWGIPPALCSLAVNGWLIGQGRSGLTLGLLWTAQAINILASLGLALGLGLGVDGIAIAAVISEYAAAGIGLLIAWRLRPQPCPAPSWSLAEWLPTLVLNRDIFIRSLALQAVFSSLAWIGTHLGDRVVAANTLLLNGLELVAFVLDGLANAVEALAGQRIGASDADGLRRVMSISAGWTLIGALLFSTAFALGGRLFVDMQTDLEPIRHIAIASLPWLVLLPPIAGVSYLLDGLFIAATRPATLRNTMLIAAAGYAVLVWLTRPLGNQGLWLAFSGFMLLRGGGLLLAALRLQQRRAWLGTTSTTRL
ncbi:putative efflux protein, MATE family [Frateuria aurantia DSM 6220]|uniref:Putative efflux protein, MATE family n=2 Tax=Frateuria aurantia TaxID=81475 RepID=H8L6A4_FRAAD|nr:putative efflux protein, MATE family [Frateuria aurantia DSM 6220]